jgi:ABC-type uncharacterized transport system YnjBCD substrate-binding protein
MKKTLLLVFIAIAFSGCASNSGMSDWEEWNSRLKKDTPSMTPAEAWGPTQGQNDSQDWGKHGYGQ